MNTGEKIQYWMNQRGYSYGDLSTMTGITRGMLQKYITGFLAKIPIDRLQNIARALNISTAYLLGWTEDPGMFSMNSAEKSSETVSCCRIPILGRISAGLPLYAEQNIEGYTITDQNHGAEYYALRVKGDSMNAAGINEGDLVVVRRQEEVEDGDIAIVLVDHEDATVKRWHQSGNIVQLIPCSTNPENVIQFYDIKKTEVSVLGKVVVIQKYV